MLANLLGNTNSPGLIHDALEEVYRMIQQEEGMFEASSNAFLTGEPPQIDLSQKDQDINVGERLVRRLVAEHLALNPHKDLPVSLALISIIHDVERIGDYTKSLSELAEMRPPIMANGNYAGLCREIQAAITPLFTLTLQAVKDSDEHCATEVMQRHRKIKAQTDTILSQAMAETVNQQDALYYTVGSRYLRRTSAHLSNIASSIANPFDQLGRND